MIEVAIRNRAVQGWDFAKALHVRLDQILLGYWLTGPALRQVLRRDRAPEAQNDHASRASFDRHVKRPRSDGIEDLEPSAPRESKAGSRIEDVVRLKPVISIHLIRYGDA